MRYFFDDDGQVCAFDPDQIAAGYPLVPMVELTSEQVAQHLNPAITQEQINAEARAYLSSTDWYVIRSFDGEVIPEFVVHARQAARERVIDI
jgi:hypothetical protein